MSQVTYWKVLTRRKTLTNDPESETKLNRVLTTYDLTALGVGATLGVGVYVLAGHVAKDQAGPSVVISFAIAAMASLLAGLCYAEFGARVPKAGSAYIYSYVCIGEFAAFVIGWNLILEYIIGSASVCRGISLYLDTLVNNTIKNTCLEVAPIEWGFLATYFDFFAFSLAVAFGVFLSFGFQTSTLLNNCCTLINVGIVIFVIIVGAIKADIKNWEINPQNINITGYEKPPKLGDGGFFPFGFEGTLKGAATCFFGFVGFDCIATTGEEVKEPRRAIPRAILFSLLVIFLSYFGVSTVLTLIWPYYLQDVDAPLPYAFQQIGLPFAYWIVTIGGMLGLVASLFGALFPLPRIIYAMSQDGLLFRFLGKISPRFKTPVVGSICAACLTGIISGLFDLRQLVNMLSIGTLLAYTVVAISITILRFMDNTKMGKRQPNATENSQLRDGTKNRKSCNSILIQIFNFKRLSIPNDLSTSIVCFLILTYCLCCLAISLIIMYAPNEILAAEPWSLTLLGILITINLIIVLAISVQPREEENPYFKVPLVPLVPAISIFVNIYLMLQLDIYTWIRFGIWMSIGLVIYIACFCLYSRKTTYNNIIIKSYLIQNNNGIINQGFESDSDIEKCKRKLSLTEEDNIKSFSNNEIESSNNSVQSIQSQVKSLTPKQSLDEIILVSEISDTMKEMKLSNGKTFFIENDLPKNDTNDLNENEDNNGSSIPLTPGGEDAVIAILDNVLQNEDAESNGLYSRKTSIDSELMPSFVEMSIAAMIHSTTEDVCFREEEENVSSTGSVTSDKETIIKLNGKKLSGDNKKSDINLDNISDASSIAAINISMVSEKKTSLGNKVENCCSGDLLPVQILQRNVTPRNSGRKSIQHQKPDNEYTETKDVKNITDEINLEDQLKNSSEETINDIILIDNPPPKPPPLPSKMLYQFNESLTNSNMLENVDKPIKSSYNLNKKTVNDPSVMRPIITNPPVSRRKLNISIIPLKAPASPTLLRRRSSATSSASSNDENDPNRLENFKQKLSRLMARPRPLPLKITTKKTEEDLPKENSTNYPKSAPADTPTSPLKLSKSEADIRQLVLNAIKDTSSNVTSTNNDTNQILDKNSESNIPKPPKFDPILYKSLGAKTNIHGRDRPKLDELVNNDNKKNNFSTMNGLKSPGKLTELNSPNVNLEKENDEPIEPIHFKDKLAALIKRGPSYRIQKQLIPPDASPRNSIENNEKYRNNYSNVLKAIKDAKNVVRKDSINKSNNYDSINELEETKNKLRPLV